MTIDEFRQLETHKSSYHRYIYEFKGVLQTVSKKRGRNQHQPSGSGPKKLIKCYCDATEAGNVTREMNHFSRLGSQQGSDDEDARSNACVHDEPSARFVQVIDSSSGLPHVLVVALRDMREGEEVVVDYGADYFENMEALEEGEDRLGSIEVELKEEIGRSIALSNENSILKGELRKAIEEKESLKRQLSEVLAKLHVVQQTGVLCLSESELKRSSNGASGGSSAGL